jgi:hypothetical protein
MTPQKHKKKKKQQQQQQQQQQQTTQQQIEAKNNPKSIRDIKYFRHLTPGPSNRLVLHLSPLQNDENMSKFSLISALLLLTALFGSTHAFLNDAQRRSSSRSSSRSSLSPLRMTVLTSNGKKIDIPEGTPLKTACEKLGVKPKYSCKR